MAGKTTKLTLFCASVATKASPMACPVNDSEPAQGQLVTVALPTKFALVSSPINKAIPGEIVNGFAVELKEPEYRR